MSVAHVACRHGAAKLIDAVGAGQLQTNVQVTQMVTITSHAAQAAELLALLRELAAADHRRMLSLSQPSSNPSPNPNANPSSLPLPLTLSPSVALALFQAQGHRLLRHCAHAPAPRAHDPRRHRSRPQGARPRAGPRPGGRGRGRSARAGDPLSPLAGGPHAQQRAHEAVLVRPQCPPGRPALTRLEVWPEAGRPRLEVWAAPRAAEAPLEDAPRPASPPIAAWGAATPPVPERRALDAASHPPGTWPMSSAPHPASCSSAPTSRRAASTTPM